MRTKKSFYTFPTELYDLFFHSFTFVFEEKSGTGKEVVQKTTRKRSDLVVLL